VGLGLNYLACIAARRGQMDRVVELLGEAERRDPRHWVLLRNQKAFRQWMARPASERGRPPEPIAGHEFQLLELTAQPTLPGPLRDDFAVWQPPVPPPARPVGSGAPADPRKLRVVAP